MDVSLAALLGCPLWMLGVNFPMLPHHRGGMLTTGIEFAFYFEISISLNERCLKL
jgi:hypothetical protein